MSKHSGRDESGWCSDVHSSSQAWKDAGVRSPLEVGLVSKVQAENEEFSDCTFDTFSIFLSLVLSSFSLVLSFFSLFLCFSLSLSLVLSCRYGQRKKREHKREKMRPVVEQPDSCIAHFIEDLPEDTLLFIFSSSSRTRAHPLRGGWALSARRPGGFEPLHVSMLGWRNVRSSTSPTHPGRCA